MMTVFPCCKTPTRMTSATKICSCPKSLSSRILGFCIIKRSTQFSSSCPRRFWTDTTWWPNHFNLRLSTWASTQQMPGLLTSLMRLLTKWLSTTSLSFKLFFPKTMSQSDLWLQTISKFKIQFTEAERLFPTSKSCMVSLTKSSIMSRRWQMSSKRGQRRTCSNMHTNVFWKTQRSLTNQSFKKNLMKLKIWTIL